MKKAILLIIVSFVQCQTNSNIISETEFNSIKINNTKFIDLKNTLGKQSSVEVLFGVPNKIEKDDDPIYGGEIFSINFYYPGLEFSFFEKELSNIKITSNYSSVIIKGSTVTIGDNISKLGAVSFNTQRDGSKSIVYQYCDGCNNYIYIYFNQSTKVITEIGFIEQT